VTDPSLPLKVPPGAEVIGNYVVEHVIGKGSFAEVKLGRNIKTGDQARVLNNYFVIDDCVPRSH